MYPVSTPTIVKQFKGGFKYLSNFYICKVNYKGIIYPSAEHAYQAQKTKGNMADTDEDDEWREQCIDEEITPSQIKKLGRKVPLRSDWEMVKLQVMEHVLLAKFTTLGNEVIKQLLLETEGKELQEGNTWNDVYWGMDLGTGYGENHLGELLMKIRKELLANEKTRQII